MDLQQYLEDERQRLIDDENYHRQQKEEHERKELEASIQRKYLEDRLASLIEQFPSSPESNAAPGAQPVESNTRASATKDDSIISGGSVEVIPDELRRAEFQGMSLIDVAVEIAGTLNTSFTADDVVDKVYHISNEDERKACKRSFSAAMSRAALDGLIAKVKRGTFARKDLIPQPEEVMNGLFSD